MTKGNLVAPDMHTQIASRHTQPLHLHLLPAPEMHLQMAARLPQIPQPRLLATPQMQTGSINPITLHLPKPQRCTPKWQAASLNPSTHPSPNHSPPMRRGGQPQYGSSSCEVMTRKYKHDYALLWPICCNSK